MFKRSDIENPRWSILVLAGRAALLGGIVDGVGRRARARARRSILYTVYMPRARAALSQALCGARLCVHCGRSSVCVCVLAFVAVSGSSFCLPCGIYISKSSRSYLYFIVSSVFTPHFS